MTDSQQLGQTEKRVLNLINQFMVAMKLDESKFMNELSDDQKVKIFADCMTQSRLSFLSYLAPASRTE